MTLKNKAKMMLLKRPGLKQTAFGILLSFVVGCQNTGSNSGGSSLDKFFSPLPGNNSAAPPPNAVTPKLQPTP